MVDNFLKEKTPEDFGLPHEEFRTYQLESIHWAIDNIRRKQKVIISEMPTGSGKSAIAAAIGSKFKTGVLTITKSLQDQYGSYGFDILKGMNSYQCALIPAVNADLCAFRENMLSCPVAHACEYLQKRTIFRESAMGNTNYSFAMSAPWYKDMGYRTVVCDEAHKLKEVIRNHCSIALTKEYLKDFGLQMPQLVDTKSKRYTINNNILYNWIKKSIPVLISISIELANSQRIKDLAKGQKADRLAKRLENIMFVMEDDPENIFTFYDKWDKAVKSIPLFAKGLFNRFFVVGEHTFDTSFFLMSATIGNIDTFVETLGIDDYTFRSVPNIYHPLSRPVYIHKSIPRFNYRSPDRDYDKQADEMAETIKDLPRDWRGIVHVNSIAKQKNLCERLARRGLQDRIFAVPGGGTDYSLAMLTKEKRKIPNVIAVSYSMKEGVDLGDFNINIAADVPFSGMDMIVRKRLETKEGKKEYRYDAAIDTEQRLGRTRRGRDQDYDLNGEQNGYVAIMDMSYKIIESELSKSFRESFVYV